MRAVTTNVASSGCAKMAELIMMPFGGKLVLAHGTMYMIMMGSKF